MAEYFKTPFNINGEYHYIEVKVPKVNTSSAANIVCCVDVSGSMSGAPIRNVCEVLRDIYKRTKTEYPLFTYNTTADTTKTIKSVENQDLIASGGTSFSSVFRAIQNYLIRNQKPTTLIFMTDGQDTDSQTALQSAMQMLRLSISALPKTMTVVFHVIGFGEVNNIFLEQVRKLGTKEGLFRYSTQSAELQNNFNDMFEYAMSAREFTINMNGHSYTSSSNEETVGFLINTPLSEEITFKSSEGESKLPLKLNENVRSIQVIRALNLLLPENEQSVQQIRTYLFTIHPQPGTDLMEKLELEQIKKEIDERMMEYTRIFTQIRMGQVPEQVQLRLNALRHDATFANTQRRNRLELRINKNVDYFRKTDISGILDGYKKNLDQQSWNEIKEQKSNWVCTYSHDDIYEMMRKTTDNIMCLGILVERNEEAIEDPTKGLKLVEISNTIISYDSFIAAMNSARSNAQQQTTTYGEFNQINETFCIVGQLHEKINAVIPLYIHFEHMKRIRILEGIWLGYLYTLDSLGYDKEQEIGLLKLVHDIIMKRTDTTRCKEILHELEKVCHFIITESIGFKSEYGENTYENFMNSIHERQNRDIDLIIPLMIGYLKKDLKNIVVPVYYESIRRCLHSKHPKDKQQIIERLIYGSENQQEKVVANKPKTANNDDENMKNPDYVEQSFIAYFHDEMSATIELIPETTPVEDRKIIRVQTDIDYIKELLQTLNLSVPKEIKNLLKYAEIDENYIENNLDYEDLRKELLMILNFDKLVPQNVNKTNIYQIVDGKLQGDRKNTTSFHLTTETIRTIVYVMLNSKTLEGFAGLLRKYCPKRCGPIFTELIKQLMDSSGELYKEKLIALLTNTVSHSRLYNNEISKFCWQPLADVDVDTLERLVGINELKQIEKDNLNKPVLHCYRTSNKLNQHGYGNYNPNLNYTFTFSGYRYRH